MGVWKLENASSVNERDPLSIQHQILTVVPNPASGDIHIQLPPSSSFDVSRPVRYTISTLTGAILQESVGIDTRMTFTTEYFPTGIYCLRAHQGMVQAAVMFSVVK